MPSATARSDRIRALQRREAAAEPSSLAATDGSGGSAPPLVLKDASSGAAKDIYRRARFDVRPPAELATYLSPPVRAGSWAASNEPATLWPLSQDPDAARVLEGLRTGAWFVVCVAGMAETAHQILAIDRGADCGRFLGAAASRGPALVLGRGRSLGIAYAQVVETADRDRGSKPPSTEVFQGAEAEELARRLGLMEGSAAKEGAGSDASDITPSLARMPEMAEADAPFSLGDGEHGGASDELHRWHRQGLLVQRHALNAALDSAFKEARSLESVRRLSNAFGVRFAEHFPELSQQATAVSHCVDDEVVGQAEVLIEAIDREIAIEGSRPATILVVEDEQTTALLIRRMIDAPNREVVHCTDGQEALQLLRERVVDLVILDLSLPGADGREVLVDIRQRASTAAIPVIVLSGSAGAQPQTEVLALGADAFYTKDVDFGVFSAAVAAFLQRAAQIRDRALRDPLTGLKARNVFTDALRDQWIALRRHQAPCALAILDVDRLGTINEFHGDDIGDLVLRDLGRRLKDVLRRSDLVTRWGADEFAVAFPHTDIEGAHVAIGKVATSELDARLARKIGGRQITFSTGIAALEDHESLEAGMAIAERRLAEAARGAGGRIVYSDEPAAETASMILVVEHDPLTASLVDDRLTRDGLSVIRVSDGLEALESIHDTEIAAIILDVATPGMDGFGILRSLRQSSALAHVPVIMLTLDRESQVSKAFRMGATDVLRKPFALSELSARVRGMVERG